MRWKKCLFVNFLILFCFFSFSFAEGFIFKSDGWSSDRKTWVNLGVGLFALNANVSFQYGKKIISVRYSKMGAIDDFEASDIGVLIGHTLCDGSVLFSGGIGLGLISGSFSQASYEKSLLGIPVETQLFFRLSESFGIGLYGFLNINSEKTLGNVCLSVQFGKLY